MTGLDLTRRAGARGFLGQPGHGAIDNLDRTSSPPGHIGAWQPCCAPQMSRLGQKGTAGMSERPFRKPNSLKHGGFSRTELLPWEDVNKFEELRRALREEFEPKGPLEEDCVSTILSNMWRKRRVREKRNLDIAAALDRVENHVLWKEPPPLMETSRDRTIYQLQEKRPEPRTRPADDYEQLLGFSSRLYGDAQKKIVEISVKMLPREFSSHLREKVPPEKFEMTQQWIVALKERSRQRPVADGAPTRT
jgi:hypothetical protein